MEHMGHSWLQSSHPPHLPCHAAPAAPAAPAARDASRRPSNCRAPPGTAARGRAPATGWMMGNIGIVIRYTQCIDIYSIYVSQKLRQVPTHCPSVLCCSWKTSHTNTWSLNNVSAMFDQFVSNPKMIQNGNFHGEQKHDDKPLGS